MDLTAPIAGGASVAMLALLLATFFRYQIIQTRHEAKSEARFRLLERDNQWCQRGTSILVQAMMKSGIPIPDEFWDAPPPINGVSDA